MKKEEGLYIPDEGVIDAFREIDNVGFIPTEVAETSEEETLTKVYVPVYIVEGFYAENTNPITKEYNNIDSALSYMEDNPDRWGGGDYYEPYNELMVEFRAVWLDSDGDEYEEIESGLTNEDIDDCPLIQEILGRYRESIADYTFASKNDMRVDTQLDLSDKMAEIYDGREYDYEGHVVYLKAQDAFYGKYTEIEVVDKDSDEVVGYIELRFADHSYNPANNYGKQGAFISVVVNTNDPTENKYHGMYNLRYDDGADADEILEDIDERMEDIMTYGEFLTRDGEDFYGV